MHGDANGARTRIASVKGWCPCPVRRWHHRGAVFFSSYRIRTSIPYDYLACGLLPTHGTPCRIDANPTQHINVGTPAARLPGHIEGTIPSVGGPGSRLTSPIACDSFRCFGRSPPTSDLTKPYNVFR